ncbi:MAG: hypothetical protein EOQ33_18270 [Mesorhizobium sp.]|nr:MAG: hypothetical protein EOQ33_18270 [Mesorhizobium sp.]
MPDISPTWGGDWMSLQLSPIFNVEEKRGHWSCRSPPLVGEMSGRTEGGAKERHHFGNPTHSLK